MNERVVGSGKPGTPCERMQRAKLNAAWVWARVWCPPDVVLELLELPDDPHAAIAIAIPAAAIRFAPGRPVITAVVGTASRITRP